MNTMQSGTPSIGIWQEHCVPVAGYEEARSPPLAGLLAAQSASQTVHQQSWLQPWYLVAVLLPARTESACEGHTDNQNRCTACLCESLFGVESGTIGEALLFFTNRSCVINKPGRL